jgi:hypothetical protein
MLYILRPIFEGRTGLSVRGRFTLACGPKASSRAGKRRPGWQAHYVAADVRTLPLHGNRFHAVVVSKLFQHVHNWQLACQELSSGVPAGWTYLSPQREGRV